MQDPTRLTLKVEQLESRDVPSAISGAIVPGRYIVTLRPDVDAVSFAQEVQGRGHAVSQVYTHGVKGIAYTGALLGFDPRIASIEPDRMVFIDGKGGGGGKPPSPPPPPAEIVPTGVERIGGTGGTGATFSQVNVAIIDTGIGAHTDLNVVGGINYTSNKPDKWADDNGHGTHVAGTVAALDNGFGVVGVAPGASLWAVKVLNRNGGGWLSDIVAGVNWVTETRMDNDPLNDIAVANMSLGFFGYSDALYSAIQSSVNAGVVYVVSAGNSTMDSAGFAPASYPFVITVSALADSDGKIGGKGSATSYGADDTLATFSNFGPDVDLAAPGVDILSTLPGDGYGYGSGTSMAAPHVTGMVARYVAQYGTVNAEGKYILANGNEVELAQATLVGAAQPMGLWSSAAIGSDSDIFHEGLIYIRSTNVGVQSLALAPGGVDVTVVNNSSQDAWFTVFLFDNGTLVGSIRVQGLGAGQSTTVSFEYTALAGRTLTAEVRTTFDLDLTDNISDPLIVS